MDAFITILAFVLILGLLVFVHELGHFLVARRNGIKVEEFAFGLPLLPAVYSHRRGETTYSIYPVPLGGFVRMLGEDGKDKTKRSFSAKSPGIRAKVLVAGVAMNVLLAFVLLTIGFIFRMPPLALCASSYPGATFTNNVSVAAVADGPAREAGIVPGDQIRTIEGTAISCSKDVPRLLSERAGAPTTLILSRNDQATSIVVTPRDSGRQRGTIGIAPTDNYENLRYPLLSAPLLALMETGAIIAATLTALADLFVKLFTAATVPMGVSGPVGIAKYTGQVIDLGPIMMLRFVAILSLSLAVFNILPIPALDGGRLLFVGVEALRGGKPITARLENAIHTAGFVALIGFLLLITYFDLTR